MTLPHVKVLLDGDHIPPALGEALRRLDAAASFARLASGDRAADRPDSADLFVIVRPDADEARAAELDRVCDGLRSAARRFLTLTSDGRLAPSAAPAVSTDAPESIGDRLIARLGKLLRGYAAAQHPARRPTRCAPRQNSPTERFERRLTAADARAAALRAPAVVRCAGFSFHELFEPVRFVGGEYVAIRQVDADHVMLLAAGALEGACPRPFAEWIQRIGRRAADGGGLATRPDAALAALNRALCEAGAAPVAATIAVLHTRTRRVDVARAGAPFPLIRRAGRTLALARPSGILAGVDAATTYALETVRLGPSDSIVVLSRGVECLLKATVSSAAHDAKRDGFVADDLGPYGERGLGSNSPRSWYRILREGGPGPAFERLRERRTLLRRIGYPLRDVTAAAIEAV